MKKIYYLLSLALAFSGVTTMSAVSVVTKVTKVTALSQLTDGAKLLFFNNGRQQYLFQKSAEDTKVYADANFAVNKIGNTNYVWTLNSYDAATFAGMITSSFNAYIPTLPSGGDTNVGATGDTFTFALADETNSYFTIAGTNGKYFNGNKGAFTGWGEVGGNSNYILYLAETGDVSSQDINLLCSFKTAAGAAATKADSNIVRTIAIGDSIAIPDLSAEYFGFDAATSTVTVKNGKFLPQTGNDTYLLNYIAWPVITINMVDAEGNVLGTKTLHIQKGQAISLPTPGGLYSVVDAAKYTGLVATTDTTLSVTYAKSLPFKTTTVEGNKLADNTTYYTMTLRGKYMAGLPKDTLGTACPLLASIPADNPDSCLWAFVGDADNGFTVYNKATGAAKALYTEGTTDGSAVMLVDATSGSTQFTIISNSNGGYSFTPLGATAYWNDFGNNNIVKLYNTPDVGSKIIFAAYDPAAVAQKAEAKKFLQATNYLRAADCVGGWASSKMTALQTALTNKDLDACEIAINSLKADKDTIKFDATKSYYIESAFTGFITEQVGSNVRAIYDKMDTDGMHYAAWKDKVAGDKSFLWNLAKGDSTGYTIQNVNTGLKMGTFLYGRKDTLTTTGATYYMNKCVDSIFVNSPASWQLYVVYPYAVAESACLTVNSGVSDATATEGFIGSYKLKTEACGNYWRLRPVDHQAVVGITTATVATPKANAIYDLQGRRVNNPSKGIYIMNGKKVYIK